MTGLPTAAERSLRRRLEEAKRLTALQVDTLAHAVDALDDEVGWSRLTELGTSSTVRAQEAASAATLDALNATLEAAGTVGDIKDLGDLVRPGKLASGKPVRGMFAATRDIVARRMTAPDMPFPMALDASAKALVGFAASEPHRIGRDGQLAVGLSDDRFNRYRRVAVGTTCTFCLMLASRGAVYLTAASAGQGRRYHHMCDCYVELVVDQDAVARSQALQGDWRNAIRDPQRMSAADIRREWANLPDAEVARAAARGSREAAAELAAREAFDAVNPSGVTAEAVNLGARAPWADAEGVRPGRVSITSGNATVESDLWSFHGVEMGTKFVDEFTPEQVLALRDATERVAANLDEVMTANPLAGSPTLRVSLARLDPGVGGLTTIPDDVATEGIVMRINTRLFAESERVKWLAAGQSGKVQPGIIVDPLRATVAHEYGHAYAIAKGGESGPNIVAARAVKPLQINDVSFNGFSAYGQSNIDETYAEAFAEWAMRADIAGDVHPVTAALAKSEGWP